MALVGPLTEIFKEYLPEVKLNHIADDSLIQEVIANDKVTPAVRRRLLAYYHTAATAGAAVVFNTCSSVGDVADLGNEIAPIPVFRIDYPMAVQAVNSAKRIAVVSTLPTTLNPTRRLLERAAREAGKDVVLVDRAGALCEGEDWMNPAQAQMAQVTNREHQRGPLTEIIKDKDVFIGVSAPKIVTSEMIATMARDAIVFAMANPTPEIMPEDARAGGARVVATGRSDYPNQINNVLVFPGLFRGALMVEARQIVEEMKLAAARAIASLCGEEELNEEYIIPGAFDKRVALAVAEQVAQVAEQLGIAGNPGNREF